MANSCYFYILASHSGVLYAGITNDLRRSVWQHKAKQEEGFTAKYNVNRLVYYEECCDVRFAITREKQVKGWTRAKKLALIQSTNPELCDLSMGWY